jgi:hypothetical protein
VLALRSACIVGATALEVIVTDDTGAPLSGARVLSASQPGNQTVLDGTTSQEGNVLIFGTIEPGEYQLQVSCPGYALQTTQVTVQRGKTAEVTFKLKVP